MAEDLEKELQPRELGEMLQSVPIGEVNPTATEEHLKFKDSKGEALDKMIAGLDVEIKNGIEDVVMSDEMDDQEPMNIIDRGKLVNSEKEKGKTDDDKLYNKITNMSDDELHKAVVNEATDLKDGDGSASKGTYTESKDSSHAVNSLMLNSLSDEEAMSIYEIGIKVKADPSFNIVAALPERIYSNISLNCAKLGIRSKRTIGNYARMLVLSLIDEMAIDKECQIFQDELSKALAFPEIVDMYAEHTRELMEKTLPMQADLQSDPKMKEELLAVSKAYVESYNFARQLQLLEDEKFLHQLNKKVKHFERSCEDFDFVMSKSILKAAPIKCLLEDLPHVLKVNEGQCKMFIVTLAEVSKNIRCEDKPGIWFMYNSVRNIISLARTGHTKTKFSEECIELLKNFFTTLELNYTKLYSV